MTLRWNEEQPPAPKREFALVLASLKEEQQDNPDMWAEIGRYASIGTSRQAVNRLRKQYLGEGFEIRSSIDQETREGVVYARYGGSYASDE